MNKQTSVHKINKKNIYILHIYVYKINNIINILI